MSDLTAGVFHFPPFTYITTDPATGENSYSGVEVTILRAIADSLDLKVRFTTPSDGNNHWGSVYPNGTSNGLIGDVIKGVVDVGAAEFFNQGYRNLVADPSQFYNYDYFCYLLAKPAPDADWTQLFKPFQTSAWIATGLCAVLTALFLLIFNFTTDFAPVKNIELVTLGYYARQATTTTINSR